MNPIHALIVEDFDSAAMLATYMLKSRPAAKITSEIATSLSSAIMRLSNYVLQRVDVILLDLGLPDAQDLAALQTLREKYPSIAIIVLTGMGYTKKDQTLAAGAQAYLEKPTECDTLVNTIREVYERFNIEKTYKHDSSEVINKLENAINR